MTAGLSQLSFVPVERLLSERSRSSLSGDRGVLVSMVVDASIDKVEVVNFYVAGPDIVRVLVLLRHDVGVDIIEWTVGMESVLVEIIRPSHSLADWTFIVVVLEFVIVAAVDVAW